MKTYRVPRTELSVSCIAYGCANLAGWHKQPLTADITARAERLIRTSVDQGITLFDHADVYGFGKSEEVFGAILKAAPGLRQKLVLQSKCGQVFSRNFEWGNPIYVDLTRQHIEDSVDGSLRRLGTDYLDILLLHAPSSLVRPDEIADAFAQLHRQGKVRYFGVSNYSPAQLDLLKKSVSQPIVVNQIHLGIGYPHAFVDGAEFAVELAQGGGSGNYLARHTWGVLDYCRAEGIQIQAWSPVRSDLISPQGNSPPELRRLAHRLAETARAMNITPAVLALAWLLHHPAGIVPITGSGSAEHIVDNCAAEGITLSDADWYALLAHAVNLRAGSSGL